ncbi:MAG TPA: methyltransferase domain-containing protein [Candidatus Baltobacteraceae bacterium]|nr:methyltransferase domain-containing protein [Candidatus Baltobacteraceae bacterium]
MTQESDAAKIDVVGEQLIKILACPLDRGALMASGETLLCEQGHTFAVEGGIPIFTDAVRREATPKNMEASPREPGRESDIDPFVDDWLVNTNGNLYWPARGRLARYPIPRFPLAATRAAKVLVDVGCSWGRWSVAAARAGFFPIGLDVHIDALAAAGRVSRQLAVQTAQVCGDVEVLPFRSRSVDVVFSYSVLQHIDRAKVRRFLSEAARVLKPGGLCLVQLPNALGAYSILRRAARGFRDASPGTFEMRYWTRDGIRRAIESAGLRDLRIRADGFFSQNPQLSDLDLLSAPGKLVVLSSYAGCKLAEALPMLVRVADSLWVEAQAPANDPADVHSELATPKARPSQSEDGAP